MEAGSWQFVVVTGLAIGVASGVTTAILLGIFAWSRRRLERREQVRFIRRYILAVFARIGSLEQGPALPDTGSATGDLRRPRLARFRALLRDLEVFSNYRLTKLDYEIVAAIKRVLQALKDETDVRYPHMTLDLPNLEFYEIRYGHFAELEWLGLPKEPPWGG